MIFFGPAGNSESFYEQGHKHTVQAFKWLADMGLNAFEYSFGRGVRIKQETAELIGQAAAEHSVRMSVHAPYYINLATHEPEKAVNNFRYLRQSAEAARWMGAKRVVFHPGAQGQMERNDAYARVKASLMLVIEHLDNEGLFDIEICPETMGKIKQIGDLDEVIALCKLDERIVPAIDFGHLHARGCGAIQCEGDYAAILDKLEDGLGGYRAKHFHVHFSRIAFTNAGERMHKTFEDIEYGPDFAPLAKLIAERGLEPVVICESKGTMAEDALEMKTLYLEALKRYEDR